jgi:hypothetical protein
MNTVIIFGAIVACVSALIILAKVPAALVYFSLLVGQLLISHAGSDVYGFVSAGLGNVGIQWIQLGLLLLPVMLTMLFLKGSVKGAVLALEIIPAVLTGLVLVLLTVPLIPNAYTSLQSNPVWKQIETYQGLLVFTTSLACLLTVWFSYPKGHHRRRHH